LVAEETAFFAFSAWMPLAMKELDAFLEEQAPRFEADLKELLRIPSVSADSNHRDDVRRAAQWMVGRFEQMGLATELIETAGHPLVFAESPAVPGAPTVLVYGHYDVQPPDPLDEWISPPFEPTEREGNLYARGATDDKGQMLTHVLSAQAWRAIGKALPLQLKFLIEGEEEVGSEHLESFIAANRDKLACDCVVISDTCQFGPGQPAITYGLRGIAYYELRLSGPKQDLHSGTFGGAVVNPAQVLAHVLAELKDATGRIQIPGFYDDVLPLSAAEEKQFAELNFDEERFRSQLGVAALGGEESYSTLQRRWSRPCCDINGLWSGYQGEGEKTVLPARAGAKFSFRLVPNQDSERVTAGVREFVAARIPPGVTWELIDSHGAPGVVVSLDSPYMQAAADAIEQGFGCRPVYIREGGSIPIVTKFSQELAADVLLLGWGLNDDNTHSPNEKFSLADFHRGIKASAYLWRELAAVEPGRP
jgi:succinyl-diaminopimelate desuccinylase